MITQEKIFHNL